MIALVAYCVIFILSCIKLKGQLRVYTITQQSAQSAHLYTLEVTNITYLENIRTCMLLEKSKRRISSVLVSFLVLLTFLSCYILYTHLEHNNLLGTSKRTTRRRVNAIISMFQRSVYDNLYLGVIRFKYELICYLVYNLFAYLFIESV
jgi:hypothetical protein